MKKVAVSQSNYIPWKGYFDMIRQVDVFVVYDEVQYTKNDWRNRNRIVTERGVEWLTIPIVTSGKMGQKISEAHTTDNKWRLSHWSKIKQCYGTAPCFHEYAPVFKDLYFEKTDQYLTDINTSFMQTILQMLGITTEIVLDSELNLTGDRNERLVQVCQKVGADTYLSGPAAQSYLDNDLFDKNGIDVQWMNYEGYPEYPQLYGDFEHSVSILDLLFNMGDESIKYLDKRPV